MKEHLVNAACGVLDYVAYPAGMLLVAPIILRHRGAADFGLWTVATAAVSTGAILASGFGDAGIQRVAAARGRKAQQEIVAAVRGMMSIHLVLGGCLALVGLALSRAAARYLFPGAEVRVAEYAREAMRAASALVLLRAVEAVCISTLRAFEQYGAAIQVSVSARVLSLALAGLLALRGWPVAMLLMVAVAIQSVSVAFQLAVVARRVGWQAVAPAMSWSEIETIVRDGRYTWLIAASGVLFAYADRLLLGFSRGAVSVVYYALCVQVAQPVYGLTGNGLHFLFPYFARVSESCDAATFRGLLRRAIAANTAIALALGAVMFAAGCYILPLIAGSAIPRDTVQLGLIVCSFTLMAASVVATYALVAMRKAGRVAVTVCAGSAVMMILMPLLLHVWGVRGLASARLIYGAVCLSLYVPLMFSMRRAGDEAVVGSAAATWRQEAAGGAR